MPYWISGVRPFISYWHDNSTLIAWKFPRFLENTFELKCKAPTQASRQMDHFTQKPFSLPCFLSNPADGWKPLVILLNVVQLWGVNRWEWTGMHFSSHGFWDWGICNPWFKNRMRGFSLIETKINRIGDGNGVNVLNQRNGSTLLSLSMISLITAIWVNYTSLNSNVSRHLSFSSYESGYKNRPAMVILLRREFPSWGVKQNPTTSFPFMTWRVGKTMIVWSSILP